MTLQYNIGFNSDSTNCISFAFCRLYNIFWRLYHTTSGTCFTNLVFFFSPVFRSSKYNSFEITTSSTHLQVKTVRSPANSKICSSANGLSVYFTDIGIASKTLGLTLPTECSRYPDKGRFTQYPFFVRFCPFFLLHEKVTSISAQTRLSPTGQKFCKGIQLYFKISLSSFIHKIFINTYQYA